MTPVPWADARSKIIAAALGVPIEWPNEPFTEPSDTGTVWLSVSMVTSHIAPVEIGSGVWQEEGTLYVDVIVGQGSGVDLASAMVKRVINLFRGLAPQPVIWLAVGVDSGSGRNGAHGLWWSTLAAIDFRYQDIGV